MGGSERSASAWVKQLKYKGVKRSGKPKSDVAVRHRKARMSRKSKVSHRKARMSRKSKVSRKRSYKK